MSFKVDAVGIHELGTSTEMRVYMESLGQDCEDSVKALAPVDTGKLRDSVGHKVEHGPGGWVVQVFFEKFYGLFPEFGTVKMAARPFLRPGVLKVISRVGGRLGDTGPG